MKRNIFNFSRLTAVVASLLLLGAPMLLTSCKEDISEDAFAVASKQTIIDYVSENDSLTYIKEIFDEVRLGRSANASVLSSVLSSRGNYTVFVPTNKAVQLYMDSVTNMEGATVADLTMEQKQRVALNCIIDNGNSSAYDIADFSSFSGTIPVSNLNNRRLDISLVDNEYYLCTTAKVLDKLSNVELSNGMLHTIDHVITPSEKTVSELVQAAENMRIMGRLLAETGWADSMQLNTLDEEEYETDHLSYAGQKKYFTSYNFDYQLTRSIKYTAFIETDKVLHDDWGIDEPQYNEETGEIENWETIKGQIYEKCSTLLEANGDPADFKSPENAVNQFVAYHLVEGGMSPDMFVQHCNEYHYKAKDCKVNDPSGYSVIVYDYYATMGTPRGLLKITQIPTGDQGYYLNRVSNLNNGFKDDYSEVAGNEVKYPNDPGNNGCNIKIDISNGANDNNALNGFYYPIEHVLINSTATRTALKSERIRFDVISCFPEMYSNELRGRTARYFLNDYFKNFMNISEGTEIYYLRDGYVTHNSGWKDYLADQFLVSGRYDLVMKLPPVPADGTYEIRMGVSLNPLRSMVQVYIGESPNDLQPVGLPIDQRESVSLIPGNPWVADTGDEATDRENERNLRNQGYMKGPNYITVSASAPTGEEPARNASPNIPLLRRILTTKDMSANKTYYMRFKCAIESSTTQFVLDFFEYVPTSVINSETPEDIW